MTKPSAIDIRKEGPVAVIELRRPEKANAYDQAMLRAMAQGLSEIVDDPAMRVVLVQSGTPGYFCAGADLHEIALRGPTDALDLLALQVFDALSACPLPTIAAIDGAAVGGGLELALACDLRLCSDRAAFWLPETRMGLLPAAGATLRLPRVVGEPMARRMILFGERLDAGQALAAGLVSEVVAPEALDEKARLRAQAVVAQDPLALRLAKLALLPGADPGQARAFLGAAQGLLYPRAAARRPPEPASSDEER